MYTSPFFFRGFPSQRFRPFWLPCRITERSCILQLHLVSCSYLKSLPFFPPELDNYISALRGHSTMTRWANCKYLDKYSEQVLITARWELLVRCDARAALSVKLTVPVASQGNIGTTLTVALFLPVHV